MEFPAAVERWQLATGRALQRRSSLSGAAKLGLALAVAGLTGLAAQARIPLPFTPVPVTGQVFAVLLSGVLLGRCYGGLSQVLYVAIGAAGVPWFTPGSLGLCGETGGYLLGFIPAALLVGWCTDRCLSLRTYRGQLFLMTIGVGVIYLSGAAYFSLWTGAGFQATLAAAVLPFIPFDLAKALAAAAITGTFLPRTGEDRGSCA